MTSLFKIENGQLRQVPSKPLSQERLIEEWVKNDPGLLGIEAIIVGQQVPTAHGQYVDLLALDRSGDLVIIELKKNRTPREVVAQVLDYASWVRTLATREIYKISETKNDHQWLARAFEERFGEPIPDQLNEAHSMYIVASELDSASERIVKYLSEVHAVSINTAFFTVFESDGQEWLTSNFLLDQSEVEERSARKTKPDWSGYYFVNAGLGEDRSWLDMTHYGFIGASGGDFYTKRLDQLQPGDKAFVFQKGTGYIGYGVVTQPKTIASDFETATGPLFDQNLDRPGIKNNSHDPSMAEYVVGIDWRKTFDPSEAKWFKGAFANQNIVCKLRDPATVAFLMKEFGVNDQEMAKPQY